jgi:hypothetical protein
MSTTATNGDELLPLESYILLRITGGGALTGDLTLAIARGDAAIGQRAYLSSTVWSTFNAKVIDYQDDQHDCSVDRGWGIYPQIGTLAISAASGSASRVRCSAGAFHAGQTNADYNSAHGINHVLSVIISGLLQAPMLPFLLLKNSTTAFTDIFSQQNLSL